MHGLMPGVLAGKSGHKRHHTPPCLVRPGNFQFKEDYQGIADEENFHVLEHSIQVPKVKNGRGSAKLRMR